MLGVLKPCWALRFGVVLGVGGVEVQEGCWRLVGGLGGVCGLESGLLIWVLCPLSGGVLGGQGGAFLTWREGSGRRLECL